MCQQFVNVVVVLFAVTIVGYNIFVFILWLAVDCDYPSCYLRRCCYFVIVVVAYYLYHKTNWYAPLFTALSSKWKINESKAHTNRLKMCLVVVGVTINNIPRKITNSPGGEIITIFYVHVEKCCWKYTIVLIYSYKIVLHIFIVDMLHLSSYMAHVAQ